MKKVEQYIKEHTRNCSNEIGYCHNKTRNHNHVFYSWLSPDHAKKSVEIAREEMIEKACRGYCDNMCEKGMCGMCYHKHDGRGQVKNTFKYNECNELQILINAMKHE
jgi:hypothetical protein